MREQDASGRVRHRTEPADHESTEAAIRLKIKHLLRRLKYQAARDGGGGGGFDRVTDLLLDEARTLYRNWPETPLADLPY